MKLPACSYCDRDIKRGHKWYWIRNAGGRTAHVNCDDPTSYISGEREQLDRRDKENAELRAKLAATEAKLKESEAALAGLQTKMRNLTYSFDSRKRMEEIFDSLPSTAKQDAEILKRVQLIAESRAACRKDPTINGHGHAEDYEETLWKEIEFFLLAKAVRSKEQG